ncbi:MAG: DUF4071 domain-containing protein, partial [Methylococcaceae bacterium]|nr:DUF4071 domain-containing protein [Methylococcaceae bacterium]
MFQDLKSWTTLMKPHAFVLMPFGKKTDRNQVTIDYDSVYRDLITPALAAAGLCVIRPTQEQAVGEIMSHWLQELLSADLVVADLSLDNFDIGYLLGIRQALRATGVILLNAYQLSDTPAFEYQLNYTINNRVVDAASLTRDIHALTALVELTKVANPTKPSSPIFQHIPQLAEPDWNIARVASAASFWQAHADWEVDRQTAEQCGNLNDLLRLAKATPVAQFRAEALIQTGIALCAVNNVELALQQFEQALDIVPNHLRGLQEKGHCLLQLALQEKAGQPLYAVRLHYIS